MPDRDNDRDRNLHSRIEELRKQLLKESLDEGDAHIRHVMLYLADIASILAIEYDTLMRMLDRLDDHNQLIAEHQRLIKEGDGKENGVNLHALYNGARKREKMLWIMITAIIGLVVTNGYNLMTHPKVIVKEVLIPYTNTVYLPKTP